MSSSVLNSVSFPELSVDERLNSKTVLVPPVAVFAEAIIAFKSDTSFVPSVLPSERPLLT